MSYEVEINGVTYKSKPAIDICDGCVTKPESTLCNDICASEQGCTVGMNVIWLKKDQSEEPKYTVEDVMGAIEDVTGFQCWNDIDEVKAYLAKQNNPEYKLYLELKAKFGE